MQWEDYMRREEADIGVMQLQIKECHGMLGREQKGIFSGDGIVLYHDWWMGHMGIYICQNSSNSTQDLCISLGVNCSSIKTVMKYICTRNSQKANAKKWGRGKLQPIIERIKTLNI